MELALLLAGVIAIILGCSPIVHRYVLKKQVSQAFILFISAIVYFVVVMVYVMCFHREKVYRDLKNNRRFILILGLTTFVGLFLTNIMYLYVMHHTRNVNITSILMALYPIVTLILASFILKERLNLMQMLGFSLIIVGCCIMLYYVT